MGTIHICLTKLGKRDGGSPRRDRGGFRGGSGGKIKRGGGKPKNKNRTSPGEKGGRDKGGKNTIAAGQAFECHEVRGGKKKWQRKTK